MKSRAFASAFALASLLACTDQPPARDQWLLAFGTDAPLPNLADRLRVELLGPDGSACGGCIREFAANDPASFPLSLGVEPTRDLRVRARLYRADHLLSDGTPDPVTTIDILAALGAAPTGITPLSVTLPVACIGKPADVTANTSCDPSSGDVGMVATLTQHSLPAPGSWPPSAEVPCSGPPPDGMVCLAGGVFFMGDDRSPHLTQQDNLDPFPEHVVQMSPFAIDRDELTVGEFKALYAANLHVDFEVMSKSAGVTELFYACTYSPDAEADALPLNCVSRDSAEKLCALQGKQLMTEAQYEYAARNRGADTTFPWGAADAPCAYSVVGVGRTTIELGLVDDLGDNTDCRARLDGSYGPWGPRVGGSPLDVTADGVRNLGGNLSEWVLDDPHPYTDAFWSASGLLDPVASGGSEVMGTTSVYRGASFADEPGLARAVLRRTFTEAGTHYEVGFRCVKPML